MPTEFCAVEWASSPSGGAIPQPLSLVVLLVGQWRLVLWYDPAFARYVNLVMRNVLAGHLAGPFLIWHIWEDWVICSIFTHFYYVGNILSYYHFHYYYYHIIISYWELGLEIKLIIFGNEQVSCGCRLRCSATYGWGLGMPFQLIFTWFCLWKFDCWGFLFVCVSLWWLCYCCIDTIHLFIFRLFLVLIVREFYG